MLVWFARRKHQDMHAGIKRLTCIAAAIALITQTVVCKELELSQTLGSGNRSLSGFPLSLSNWWGSDTPPPDLREPYTVALLFLTPGALPLESIWRDWLSQAHDLIPKQHIRRVYEELPEQEARVHLEFLAKKLRSAARSGSFIGKQFLYTVYVHTHPKFEGYPRNSIFHGKIIPERIVAQRMHHSLVEAEKLLLAEALKNPLNQQFVLLSETVMPLYPATFTYLQLMTEGVSRVDGCNYRPQQIEGNLDRWHPAMCRKRFWRKTSQWFTLTRPHAEAVAYEKEMNAQFAKFCHPRWEKRKKRFISCSDNEHYPAVVLAAKGLGHGTACWPGGSTYVDWTKMDKDGRPRSFNHAEMNPELLWQARVSYCDFHRCRPKCATIDQIEEALNVSDHAFVNAAGLQKPCDTFPVFPALSAKCSLFIRKIHAKTLDIARLVLQKFVQHPNLI